MKLAEAEKKHLSILACSERHISFTSLVVSVDGMLYKEILKRNDYHWELIMINEFSASKVSEDVTAKS